MLMTHFIIPACNVHSRAIELDNVETRAKVNNLRLNRYKSVEIVVTDGRRRRLVDPPPTLHDVSRVMSVKILGATLTCKLSLSEHVSAIVSACASTLHALRVLRCHGMNDAALQTIYTAVVVAKLTYAASAWWGFTSADDRRRIEAVLRRALRAGFYQSEWPTVA